ncbi:SPOR domain-containing protein [Thiomicrospira microaerophila]|uniref:SPOR domain-containing protein n=1 Tax=Thiomicrospira microaerophila TaxID=406020 RepID=UPI0005CB510B|nr:SPOR domain-containing protein [Thiomicrospira microaerophila]
MARDFKKKPPPPKFEFQRRSQQMRAEQETQERRKLPFTGKIGLFFLSLVTAFLIISHFMKQFKQSAQQPLQANEVYQPGLAESLTANPDAPGALAQTPLSVPAQTTPEAVPAEPDVLNFSFYTELPQMEVVVDVEPLPISLPDPMWIQAGSFRDLAQAQREQQRLSTEDREMLISPIETQNGVFYRMMLGPFTDRLQLNQQRNALRRLGADTRIVKPPAKTLPLE